LAPEAVELRDSTQMISSLLSTVLLASAAQAAQAAQAALGWIADLFENMGEDGWRKSMAY